MEFGLFSPCSDVQKLPPSPFLGHARTERLLETVPKRLAPRQEGLSGAKTLFPGCFEGRERTEPRYGVQGGPITSLHPSVSPSHKEAPGLSLCHRAAVSLR